MTLSAGTRLGPYEILSPIGAGGMGEVYRARDPRLRRDVALKVLHAAALENADRRQRFVEEAQAAGALNHPNILAVHDVGTDREIPFIVSELIDGVSLREYSQRLPLGVKELLDSAVQIADGLSAAHEAGIVHRDLKPENIMVTRDGRVKILDFGLATLSDPETDGASSGTRTHTGLVIGTVPYMSPEQARGGSLDFRSDQFSFGLILYELATGRQAFRRDTAVQTLAAIIDDDPRPLSELNPRVPVPLRWLIERCLAKDPRQRYASTSDLARDLRTLRDRLSEVATGTDVAVVSRKPFRPWLALSLIGTGAVTTLLATGWREATAPAADVSSYRFTPLATDAGYQGWPAWSPDGKTIAYVAQVDGVVQVFTRSLASSMRGQITHSRFDCRDPFWSPDGTRIFYVSLAREWDSLWSVSAAGGTSELVMENTSTAAVSPDGKILAFFREEDKQGSFYKTLWFSSPPGAEPRKYTHPPFGSGGYSDAVLHFSPDASSLLIRASGWQTGQNRRGRGFWMISLTDQASYALLPSLSWATTATPERFGWFPDSRHVAVALSDAQTPGTHLWLADVRKDTAWPITRSSANEGYPAVSPDGGKIAFSSDEADFDLIEISVDGGQRALLTTSRSEMDPAWSPTRPEYAFVTDRTGTQQIWLRSSDGQWERPLVTEQDFGNTGTQLLETPAFSPDGQRLAYFHSGTERDASKIWISTLAGGPPVELTPQESLASVYQDAPTWSPDGNWVAYVYAFGMADHPGANPGTQHWGLAKAKVGSSEPPLVIRDNVSAFARPQWSPDGHWIICETAEGLSLLSPDTKDARILSEDTWFAYGWTADGTHLYGIRQSDDLHSLMLASIDVTTKTQRIINPNLGPIPLATPPIRGFSRMSPKSFATSLVHVRSDVWLLEGFQPPRSLFNRMMSWLEPASR